jgi:choline dehydrogenase-like flavoprotein
VKALRLYVADSGDTLRKIAVNHHIHIDELIFLNPHITGPDLNIAGRQVKLPSPTNSTRFFNGRPDPIPSESEPPLDFRGYWIPLTPLEQMAQTEYDVLIVGTGAGGGAAIWRLCEQWGGNEKRIGVIDAGDLVLPTHVLNIPTSDHSGNVWTNPNVWRNIGKSLPEFPAGNMVFALGGRTLYWGMVSPRMDPSELAAWPVTLKEMQIYYNIAERAMNVNQEFNKGSSLQEVLLKRLQENGFPDVIDAPLAINLQPSSYGVIHSTVAFSSISFLANALNHKPFDLGVKARAVQVLTEQGKAAGVKVLTPDRTSYSIKAKTIVLSASTFETPRILLQSGIPGRAIGHYLTDHVFVRGVATVDRNELPGFIGGLQIFIPQTAERPYGIHLWGPGGSNPEKLEVYLHGYGNAEPRFENMMSLDLNNLDEYGVPRIQVKFSYNAKDHAVIDQTTAGVKRASQAMKAPLSSLELLPPGSDAHYAGTCRMGDDPSSSSTNRYGQIHGISGLYVADNSILPSIGGTNPTLSTIALAIRTADYIIGQ